jgi:hypothetical protein
MSSAQEWELTVPDDGEQLMAELRKHGVTPGQRLHVAVNGHAAAADGEPPMPNFFSSFDGAPDLAERSDEILASEFPGDL